MPEPLSLIHPGRPFIIAHRGASHEAPENTLAAFRRALELGVNGIELDVVITADGVPVVSHNDDLSLLTDMKGLIRNLTLAEVKKADAGIRKGEAFRGERIPTLAEALKVLCHEHVRLIIEVKYQRGLIEPAIEAIGKVIHRFTFRNVPLIASFSLRVLSECRRRLPDLKRAIIVGHTPLASYRAFLASPWIGPEAYLFFRGQASRARCKYIHRAGRNLYVWTVNTEQSAERALAIGADGIITDDVAMIKNLGPHHGG